MKPALNDLVPGPQFLLWQMESKISLSDIPICYVLVGPQFLLGKPQKGIVSQHAFGGARAARGLHVKSMGRAPTMQR